MNPSLPFPAPEGLAGLRMLKSLEEWDRTVLAVFNDGERDAYLGVLIEESADQDKWLLAQLTAVDLVGVLDGSLDYCQAFRKAVASFTVSAGTAEGMSYLQPVEHVPEDWLPLPDLRYEPSQLSLGREVGSQPGVWAMLALSPSGTHEHTFPAKALGGVLRTFQSLLEATASALEGHKGTRGAFPDAVVRSVALRAVAFPPSSFGVVLTSTDPNNLQARLYPERRTLLETSLDAVVAMLNGGADEAMLTDRINMFGARQLRYYQTLLSILHGTDSGFRLDWKAGGEARGTSRLEREDVGHLVHVVSQVVEKSDEILSVTGELVAFNKENRWFKIVTIDDDPTTYSGQADPIFAPATVEVGRQYDAMIREVIRVNPVTLEQTTNHHLLSLALVAE